MKSIMGLFIVCAGLLWGVFSAPAETPDYLDTSLDFETRAADLVDRISLEEMSLQILGFDRGDRSRIELPAVQLNMLRALLKTGTPVIYVQLAGSAVALDGLEDELPVTFYKSTENLGDFSDYAMAGGQIAARGDRRNGF